MPLRDILSQPGNNVELIAGGGKSQALCLRIEDDKGEVRWMYESIEIIQYLKAELSWCILIPHSSILKEKRKMRGHLAALNEILIKMANGEND